MTTSARTPTEIAAPATLPAAEIDAPTLTGMGVPVGLAVSTMLLSTNDVSVDAVVKPAIWIDPPPCSKN